MFIECFCLGCDVNQGTDSVRGMPTCFADVNDNDNVNDNDKDNVNDNDNQGTCSADDNDKDNDNDSVKNNVKDKDNDNVNVDDHDNVNDNVNDNNNDNDIANDNDNVNVKDNHNCNDNVNDKDRDNDNVNDNVNQGTCFADDNFIYQGTCFADLFDEKHQRRKPNNKSPTSDISVNINDDLQSWLNDDDIITEAEFPDKFRCIISGPSECGKTFLLKKTNSSWYIF